MDNQFTWYSTLEKPFFAPPAWLFSPAWTFLYILIFISYSYVFLQAFRGHLPWVVTIPFILNLIFNFAFTPIQFGLQNNFLAALDITLVLCTLVWAMYAIYPYIPWIMYINIPYVLWVCFATMLQYSITFLNW